MANKLSDPIIAIIAIIQLVPAISQVCARSFPNLRNHSPPCVIIPPTFSTTTPVCGIIPPIFSTITSVCAIKEWGQAKAPLQQLIRRLNKSGEQGAAELAARLGSGRSEEARALAYRLYAVCDRKGWAKEALDYNSLVIAWPEIIKLAHEPYTPEEQKKLFK